MDCFEDQQPLAELAEQWNVTRECGVKPLLRRLKWISVRLRRKVDALAEKQELSRGEVWLSDNYYLVLTAKFSVQTALLGVKRLAYLETGEGEFRLIELARSILKRKTELTEQDLCAYLDEVQKSCPLAEKELALLLPALQFTALERLAQALEQDDEGMENRCKEVFTHLRTWNGFDFQRLAEGASLIHRAFLKDPSGDYPRMSMQDRAAYRRKLAKLAKQGGEREAQLAQTVVERAQGQHIGFALFGEESPVIEWLRKCYFPGLAAGSLLSALTLAFLGTHPWSFLLLWLPLLHVWKALTDVILLRFLPRRPVYRISLPDGLPANAKTLLVKTILLSKSGNQEDVTHLEQIWLANRDCGDNLSLGLLVDLPESNAPMGTQGKEQISLLSKQLDELNRRWNGQFFLFFRLPVYCEQNQTYAGWERKRGALLELGRRLRGKSSNIRVYSGDQSRLGQTKYLVTLDSDTGIGVGSVRLLVGAMLHPMNQPVVDTKRRIVSSGYAVIQPQLRTDLTSAHATAFTRLYSGCAGSDPYRGTGSELCHDLFDEASFSGKGILDIDCFLQCLDGRFPNQTILSHDILEGAYLRCGCLGQVSFSDRFPSSINAYYKRQHRWVRGDWQNLPWITERVPQADGTKTKNPISGISRWKLADNLQRSATPLFQLVCLLVGGIFGQALTTLFWVGLLSLLIDPFLACCNGVFLCQMHRRFHSRIWSGLAGLLMSIAARLLLLPLEGWTNLSAITTALWRSFVSHRRMLQWTAFASQNKAGRRSLANILPGMLSGVLLLLFAFTFLGKLLGSIWLASPLLLWLMERKSKKLVLKAGERTFLLHEAEQIWGFFADLLKPERNYLPPDNFQLRPFRGAAERTSPTNIGFAALSCLAAIDLELEGKIQVLERLSGLLDTLDRMEKWNGNLYNWYDTVTLQAMQPKVVSSVDSGNLCACLFSLSMGLRSLEEEQMADQALRLAKSTDLGCLYDQDKHLFYISYTPENDTWSSAHYDLMASEARLLSYAAIALGQVPRRHWSALSRAQLASRSYQGMASWSGTMFEYFMPHLLLPFPENSLLYESLAFCACEQLRYGQARGYPWGISESAVTTLDQNGCYGYRANGVPTLSLGGAREKTYVISPYSTFLALSILPHRAVENLKRLHACGLEGKYGLYEAAEFSERGVTPVKSWMAHHMGMSLVALDNALNDNVQVARLLSWPEMGACLSLLEECVPRNTKALDVKQVNALAKHNKKKTESWSLSGSGYSIAEPVCTLMNGASFSALVTSNASFWLNTRDLSMLDRRKPPAIYLLNCNEVTQVFPCAEGAQVQWKLGTRQCSFTTKVKQLSAKLTFALTDQDALQVNVELTSPEELAGTILVSIQPQIAAEREYLAHPTFCALTLEPQTEGKRIRIHRRNKDFAYPDLICTWNEEETKGVAGPCALERQLALGLPGFEPAVLLERDVVVSKQKKAELQFCLSLSDAAPVQRTSSENNAKVMELVCRMLPELVFSKQKGAVGEPGAQHRLWPMGISGDDPIALAKQPVDAAQLVRLLAVREYLISCGVRFDLVFVSEVEKIAQFKDLLAKQGIALGGHGGVHVVMETEEGMPLLRGMCSAKLDQLPELRTEFASKGSYNSWPLPNGVFQYQWLKDRFVIDCGDALPKVRWSMPLTNGEFGYLATETGSGYLWSKNARLFKITPWNNDVYALDGPEDLILTAAGRSASLFARRDGYPCRVSFGAGFVSWQKELWDGITATLTAFVPPKRNERVFLLEITPQPDKARLSWRMQPLMGEYDTQGLWVKAFVDSGRVVLANPVSARSGIVMTANVPWRELHLPQNRERDVIMTFTMEGPLVLRIGEAEDDLAVDQARDLLEQTGGHWKDRCGKLTAQTPDNALNHYISFWSQYQIQACRMLARTSVYQCGGAYGFRDQLQDCCALMHTQPELAAEHILRCCRHQFVEGDVLHWWHEVPEQCDAGVRTHMSDDLLWLPYTAAIWAEETGETALLKTYAPYLRAQRLNPGEKDRYFSPEITEETESVYQHCIRAIECMLQRGVGEHGLCKIGSGDWNDGMDHVGVAGRGESLWLTWFAAVVLRKFAAVCDEMMDPDRSGRYQELAVRFAAACERCWDGDRYLRGFFDSGTPLGSKCSPECQLDSIAQSFAVFGGASGERALQALKTLEGQLYHKEQKVIALLNAPFDFRGEYPGYIANYRPGARENGGQYTHAAVWLALAWFRLDEPERGWQILRDLLPEHHSMDVYQGEPFVLAGDVSLESGKEGAAGWTWYTGAAGWYYRTAVQELLGLRFRKGKLYLEPRLPEDWDGYQANLALKQGTLEIRVKIGTTQRITLDGVDIEPGVDLHALIGDHLLELEILRKIGCEPKGNHV